MVHEKVKRISVLKVPVDIIAPEDIEDVIRALYEDDRNHQIVLLSTADLMRARRSGEYRSFVTAADLVIPISLPILRTARFLKKPEPVRYEPFDFIIRVMGALERRNRSVYLFGAAPRSLARAEKNIKDTFPGLRVVGRHSGHVPKGFMPKIVEAIRKASPTLLLVGQGVHGGEKWIPRNLKSFSSGLYLWCSDVFSVFAERKSRPPRGMFARGWEWLFYLPGQPWKLFRFVTLLRFKTIALWYRLMRY